MQIEVTVNKSILYTWTCSFSKPYHKTEINPLQVSTVNKLRIHKGRYLCSFPVWLTLG